MTDRVTYLGHATVLMELADQRILTDPVLTGRITFIRRLPGAAPEPRGSAGRRPDLPRSPGSPASWLDASHLPRGADHRAPGLGRLIRRWGFERVEELGVGETIAIGGTTITAVPADHRAFGRPGARRPSRSASSWRATGAGSTSPATRTSTRACPTSVGTVWISRCCRCGAGGRGSGLATSIRNAPRTRSACCVLRSRSPSTGGRSGRSRCSGAVSTSPSRRAGWPTRSRRITLRRAS